MLSWWFKTVTHSLHAYNSGRYKWPREVSSLKIAIALSLCRILPTRQYNHFRSGRLECQDGKNGKRIRWNYSGYEKIKCLCGRSEKRSNENCIDNEALYETGETQSTEQQEMPLWLVNKHKVIERFECKRRMNVCIEKAVVRFAFITVSICSRLQRI